ncbi:MAG: efflux RND transporter periplasmic adaptor subunit [Acidobacteriota bacterium]
MIETWGLTPASAGKAWFAAWWVALALGLAGCASEPPNNETPATRESSAPPEAERVVAVSTVQTEAREVVDTASLPAELLPRRRAVLAAEVAGAVTRIHVEKGQRAAAGKVLVEVDTRDLEQRLAEAEAVSRHRTVLFQRAEKLLERRSITENQYLDALTERDVADAQLATARLMLEKARLVAPWSGTVAARHVEVGDYLAPGQAVIELLEVRGLKARAPVASSDVPYLRLGMEAQLRLDIYPDEIFRGTVALLAPELDAAARTLDIEVELDNSDGRLRPGMVARLEIPRRTYPSAVLAPLDAIVELEDAQVVYVALDERAEQRPIELGPVIGENIIVLSGLEAGEDLIVAGQQLVSPGQRVQATPEPVR